MAIYCMSGTGNSYFVGKKLANYFGLNLINIVRLEGPSQESIQDADEPMALAL